MSEMTTEESLEQVRRLIRLQKDAQDELKEQKSAKNYWFLDQCRDATDFAGIASVIERLRKIANFVGGSPPPVPWDQLQQKYLDEIERLKAENESIKKVVAPIGPWMSAAVDDDRCCPEFRRAAEAIANLTGQWLMEVNSHG